VTDLLNERDLRQIMTVIEHELPTEPHRGMPWHILEGVAALIPSDAVSCPEFQLTDRVPLLDQWLESDHRTLTVNAEIVEPEEYWQSLEQFEPCVYPMRTGDLRTPVRWSDFYSPAQLRTTPHYADFRRVEGFERGLHLALPAPPGVYRKISLWRRKGSDFTERDRLILGLLRPHLWEIDAATRRHLAGPPPVSRRELEVLRLVEQGRSNAEIARELFISVSTVRKHMEHVFDRLGVRTRGAAVALVRRHWMLWNETTFQPGLAPPAQSL
jgi:DNA-binding CsgD family transcriptional regulator